MLHTYKSKVRVRIGGRYFAIVVLSLYGIVQSTYIHSVIYSRYVEWHIATPTVYTECKTIVSTTAAVIDLTVLHVTSHVLLHT